MNGLLGLFAPPKISGGLLGENQRNDLSGSTAQPHPASMLLGGAAEDYIFDPLRNNFLGGGWSPSDLWQRLFSSGGMPQPVIDSIRNRPSYGEGETIPSRSDTPGDDALTYEYQQHPQMNERSNRLQRELDMIWSNRSQNYVYPEHRNPWASVWGSTSPFPAPLHPDLYKFPLALY